MLHQLSLRTGFLKGIRQHGQAVRVKVAPWQMPFVVGGSSERDNVDVRCAEPSVIERAEGPP